MVDIEGTELDAPQADFLQRNQIRAVCLFRRNLGDEAQIRKLTAQLQEVLGPQALIGIDQEGGSVVRATSLPQPPAAMALGAVGDLAMAESVGAAVARGVRSLGFNWNFAPVLDVNNNPANPVIAERSFGEDPRQVARLAGAWMRGALHEGVACCVKHFPGHGDTHVDSHRDLPVVDKPREALEALELLPFRALRSEAPAMMSAHIVYPQLDPEHPATLSRKVLGGVLREEWGYDGVVITDSLVMKAIHDRYGHHRAAAMALHAGADMVMALGSHEDQQDALRSIETALRTGALDELQLERAQARLDALAARYPVRPGPYDNGQRQQDEQLMRRAWAQALCTLRGAQPPGVDARVRVFTQTGVPCDGVSEAGLTGDEVAALFARFAHAEVVQLERLDELDWTRVPQDGSLNLIASNGRERYGNASRSWRPELHLVLWNPFQALDVPAPTVITWGYASGALEALRAWLEGRGAAPGHAPVQL
jgi:beta-N-acetylhexosaminidase